VTPEEFRRLERIQKDVGTHIENRMVPTLRQIRRDRINHVAELIMDTPIDAEASTLVELLVAELNSKDTALKLASYLLVQQQESGPDQIGVIGDRLKKLLSGLTRSHFHEKPPYKFAKKSFRKEHDHPFLKKKKRK